jgi:hypothetical protein
VGDIDFKVIFAAENSNKFQKTRFWKKKSVEDKFTWANGTSHISIFYCFILLLLDFKKQ